MVSSYCHVAQSGGTCTDSKCSKSHEVIHCHTCECYFPTVSLKEHLNGSRHRQNLARKGLSHPGIPLAPPSRSVPSTLQSTPLTSTSPLPEGKASNLGAGGADSTVTRSREGGVSSTKVPYCATALQGDTCVDSRCQYRHDISQCKPCGLSFPASLLNQHQSGRVHLENVASNGSTNSSTPQYSRSSQPAPPPEPTPPPSRSPLSTDRPSSIPAAELPITMSHEDGVDFVAEGTGTAADPSFPSICHTISIENTSLSDISVQSMKLAPSPNPWYE